MKIVFVHFGKEHLGIEFLSTILKQHRHDVALVWDNGLFSKKDSALYFPFLEKVFNKSDLVQEVLNHSPDLVAFSAYTSTYQWSCNIASQIKKNRNIPIVFGGSHASLIPKKVIEKSFIDYVHVGEAEDTIIPFVKAVEKNEGIEHVPNIWYKKGGNVYKNPIAPLNQNLKGLQLPDKVLFEHMIRIKDDYAIVTSKGCIYNCNFCQESQFNKLYRYKYHRNRPIDTVIHELIVMKKRYKYKKVMFWDPIFFNNFDYFKEFCKQYIEHINVPYKCNGHVTLFNHEIGNILKESGCYCVNFGIQSFNPKIRKSITNRFENNSQIKKVFEICDNIKLKFDVDLILGLPAIKEEDYIGALKFLKPYKYLNRIKCFYLAYYPNMPIIKKSIENGLLSNEDLKNIEEGLFDDWFHKDLCKNKNIKRLNANYEKVYKIYPLVPNHMREFFIRTNSFKIIYLFPKIIIVFLQFINAVLQKDYRFSIIINNYLHNAKLRFSELLINH